MDIDFHRRMLADGRRNEALHSALARVIRPGETRVLDLIPSGTPVVMSAILPVDERVHRGYGNADILDANRRLAKLCAAHPGCSFLDLTAGLKDATGGLDPRFHVGDGLHLSREGYDVWTRAWMVALAPYRGSMAVSTLQPAR